MRIALALALVLTLAPAALADDYATMVMDAPVWRVTDAADREERLTNEERAAVTACVAPKGSSLRVHGRAPKGWLWEVTLIGGAQAGCTGYANPGSFKTASQMTPRDMGAGRPDPPRSQAERNADWQRSLARAPAPEPAKAGPSYADCRKRYDIWAASGRAPARVNRWDIDKAIGEGCVDALVGTEAEQAAGRAASDECLRRWREGSDPYRRYANARELWLDIARAAGNACADYVIGVLGR